MLTRCSFFLYAVKIRRIEIEKFLFRTFFIAVIFLNEKKNEMGKAEGVMNKSAGQTIL